MTTKREYSRVLAMNGARYVLLPKNFCEAHKIQKGDFIAREIESESIRFIPQEGQ